MYLAVNARSEGRVLVPWELRQNPNVTIQELTGKFFSRSSQIYPPYGTSFYGLSMSLESERPLCSIQSASQMSDAIHSLDLSMLATTRVVPRVRERSHPPKRVPSALSSRVNVARRACTILETPDALR